jgi:predicted PolB exonuclease-like 3'-5' exonuclease
MKILNEVKIETVLFLDIETAPNWLELYQAPKNVQSEWIYKFKFRSEAPNEPKAGESVKNYYDYFAELWQKEAGLYPEFSRVVCISVGFMYQGQFLIRSYAVNNEGDLLKMFKTDLEAFCSSVALAKLCAHYGKGFDFPYIAKRMLINRIVIPSILDTAGLKPWENTNLDTHEIWKLGGTGSAGLPAICMAFGIETPKDDLNGSLVSKAFHDGETHRIATYCEKDVFALLNVFKAFRMEEPVDKSKIVKH